MDNYKTLYPNSLCSKCLGCQKLEDMRFAGVFECNNFRNMESDEGYKKAKKIIEQLKMEVELVHGASHPFDLEAFLSGKQTPVFVDFFARGCWGCPYWKKI